MGGSSLWEPRRLGLRDRRLPEEIGRDHWSGSAQLRRRGGEIRGRKGRIKRRRPGGKLYKCRGDKGYDVEAQVLIGRGRSFCKAKKGKRILDHRSGFFVSGGRRRGRGKLRAVKKRGGGSELISWLYP